MFGILLLKTFWVHALEFSGHSIGLRFNQGDRLGADVSYQKIMTDNNRLEVNLGLRDKFTSFKGTGLYQRV